MKERRLEDLFECIKEYSSRAQVAFQKGNIESAIGFIKMVDSEIEALRETVDFN